MTRFSLLFVMLFSFASQAMPAVWECTAQTGGEYVLKGLERSDDGQSFKSYTMVNLETEETIVLTVGLFGTDQADGFVAFSG
mgnify:CR=1 FL=1